MRTRASWVLFFVVLLFLVTMKTHRTYMGQGDEPHYIVFAESLLLDHDLDVSNNYVSSNLRSFEFIDRHIPHPIPPQQVQYSWHSIGLPILGIPSMLLSRALLAWFPPKDSNWITVKNTFSFSMMILAAFFAVFLFGFFRTVNIDENVAWCGALLVSITPPLLSYGFLFFTELPAAFMIIYLYSRWKVAAPLHWTDSLLIGFLPWLHMRYALVAVVLALLLLYRGYIARGRIFFYGMFIAMMWAVIAIIDTHMWSGLSPEKTMVSAATLGTSVPAMFFDRAFGLFVMAPIYLCAFAGLYYYGRENKSEAWVIGLIALALVLPVSGFPIWWAGWSPPPRYLTPLVPFLALGVIYLAQKLYERHRTFLKFALGIFLLLSGLYWQDPRLLWNPEMEGVNLYLRHWFGKVGMLIEWIWPNFFNPSSQPLLRSLLLALGVFTLNIAIVIKLRKPENN